MKSGGLTKTHGHMRQSRQKLSSCPCPKTGEGFSRRGDIAGVSVLKLYIKLYCCYRVKTYKLNDLC